MAHEVWVKRDAAGPARIYLGEPADPVPAAGDPEFSKLTAPRLIGAEAAKPVALVRRANHIEAAVTGTGDVRVTDDNVFAPWEAEGGKWEGVVSYARAGRPETRAAHALAIVPPAPQATSFVVNSSEDLRVGNEGVSKGR